MYRRIVSLLPAATEMIAALGCLDRLVGVSHDCDYPPSITRLPSVTDCEIASPEVASEAIDRWVSERLGRGEPLFTLDRATLSRLQPDLIVTQTLCDVCAPAYSTVAEMAATLPSAPRVLALEASSLDGVFDNIDALARELDVARCGCDLIASLRARMERVRVEAGKFEVRPRVAVIEWLDPLFCSGHWTPELVELAGGREVFGNPGADSTRKSWERLVQADPEVLVIACCGQTAERARYDWQRLSQQPTVQALSSVRNGKVHFVDGNSYFNRPGPRLIDSLELLSGLLSRRYAGTEFEGLTSG